jgi:phytoene dehydrogenase-like protein
VREPYDAVVIGAGHNGLTCAAYLARAGWRVLVLERRPVVGGATVSEELVPGYRFSVASYLVSLLRPEIIRELDLPRHGLEFLPLDGTFTPLPDGYLWRPEDHGHKLREIRRWSRHDADAYDEYNLLMAQVAHWMKPLLATVPPDPSALDTRGLLDLASIARRFAAAPEPVRTAIVQLLTMSAADFLEQWFESPPLLGTMSASGIIGTFLGVRTPGSAYVLLHHYLGEIDGAYRAWAFARGGTGSVSGALASAAREAGAEIRVDARVTRIVHRDDRATGVALEDGEEIAARTVVSSADPHITFLQLLEPGAVPPEFEAEVRRYRLRGSSGKVNFALDGLPTFRAVPDDPDVVRAAISISPSVEYMEHAYDDAVDGRFSRRPYIDCAFPTLVDPTLAPPGHHILTCFVQYAPYHLADGPEAWDAHREDFADVVTDALAEVMPDIRDRIVARLPLTPLDIERRIGITEGNIFHGELLLEQLFFNRPVPGYARYRSPLRDLWLCGSSTHPGGAISGAPGRNAAMELLRSGSGAQTRGSVTVSER